MDIAESGARIDFLRRIHEFRKNLGDLRDFIDVTSELFRQKQRDDVANSPDEYAHWILGAEKEDPSLNLPDELKRALAQTAPDSVTLVEVDNTDGTKSVLLEAKPGRPIDIGKVALEVEKTIKRHVSLRNSALISLVSCCEWFVAQLLHYFLDKHPAAAGLGERKLTYDELLSFDSLEDARQWIVAEQVEDLLRGNFIDWMKFFTEKLKVDKASISEHSMHCYEACLRRNLLVHNGGVVNKVYLKKVPVDLEIDSKEGDLVRVDEPYLQNCLDRFEVVFLILALELWRKIDKGDSSRSGAAVHFSYYALVEQRWFVAQHIAQYVCNQKEAPESTLLMAKVNYWQSLKWAGAHSAIAAEVSAWDVSAKGMVFQLAKHLLMDEEQNALSKIPSLLASNQLSIDDLRDWPLFRNLRSRGCLNEFFDSTGSAS